MTASRRLSIFGFLTLLALLAGLAAATQDIASAFHYPRQFGGGLADVGRLRVYPPWAFFGWYGRYYRAYPHAFDLASLVGLAVGLIPLAVAIVVVRRTRRLPRAFGAAAWARIEDVKRAKLIDPKARMTGRILGPFRRPLPDLSRDRTRHHRRRVAEREGGRPCRADPDRLATERVRLRPQGRALAHHRRPSQSVQPRLLLRADRPQHGAVESPVRGPQRGDGDRRHPERRRHPGRPLGPQGG